MKRRLYCTLFWNILCKRQHNIFIDKIVPHSPSFLNMDDVHKLKYILSIDCPPEVIYQETYALRELQSTASNWWSNMIYVWETIELLVNLSVLYFGLYVFASHTVIHHVFMWFASICYDSCTFCETYFCVSPIKIVNLESNGRNLAHSEHHDF